MATTVPHRLPTSKPSKAKKNRAELPPKRGRIKREIFGGLAKSIASAATRAGEAFGIVAGHGDGSSSSAAATPPTSGYATEENS